jgi:serine/threonine protein kinase
MPNLTSGGRPLSRGQSSSGQYDNSYLENHDYALREVETMVALNELRCPHLVKILTTKYATCPETRAARRFLFIEMEYANRGDLEAYMDATYPYPSHRPAPVIKSLFFQAIIGLHAFTSRGMVHLDIKPTNIFVDKRGDDAEPIKWYRIGGVNKRLLTSLDAILGDFGRARKLPENSQLLPFTMEHVSTYEYVAPEIGFFGDSAIVTPSMDMFAMGLTLFSLAAGKDYCDMMNAVECPAALKKRWMEIWNTEGYSVVKELAAQVASEIPKRPQLHDTLYRHVVVFGLKTQGRTAQSEAWKAALEMLGPGGPDEKQFKEHVATFDLKDGIDLCLEYTRSALGEKGLELLSGLCSFEPDERPTSSQALAYIYFNDFNRTKKEKEPFYFELETGNS